MEQPLRIFRVVLQVSDPQAAERFYGTLLGAQGLRVGGGRLYFDCGGVLLSLQSTGKKPKANTDDLYFAVDGLEAVFARAKKLGCLSAADVHGAPAGAIVERPWGERSFYAEDPDGNGLCFVDARTLFTGARTERATRAKTPSKQGSPPANERSSAPAPKSSRSRGPRRQQAGAARAATKSARFAAEIQQGHKGAALILPFDPELVWGLAPSQVSEAPGGKRGWLVRGTLAGTRFEGWIGTRWGRHFVLTDAALCARAGVKVGDTVDVVLEPRTSC